MRKSTTLAVAAALTLGVSQPGFALIFDGVVTPDVIFGSGNANGGWTIDRGNLVELGLRAKLRHNAAGAPENTFNSNGDGTYSFNAGVAPGQSSPTAEWSFEWAVNVDLGSSGAFVLDNFRYELGIDTDPTASTNFGALVGGLANPFDPINVTLADHAIGDNNTGNGDGTVAADATEYTTLIGANNVAQQSWKPHWFIDGFNPTVGGQYDFYLAAFFTDQDGNEIAQGRTDISVLVSDGSGGGGTPVPEPATLALLGLGLAGIGFSRRKARG